jgi:hypothetical protein
LVCCGKLHSHVTHRGDAEIQTGMRYQIVTRRLAEFSAQKAAREAHQNEQALARRACGYRGARFLTPAASLIFGTERLICRSCRTPGMTPCASFAAQRQTPSLFF